MATGKKKTAKRPRRKPAGRKAGAKPAPPFQGWSGDEFASLVVQLLMHEVRRVGLSDGALDSFVAGNKGDGGVDAFLKSVPPRPSHFLPGKKTVFQCKLSCPKTASLLAELGKQPRVRRLLADGADYVLVTGSDVRPDEIEPLLNEKLRALVPSWPGHAEVWSASRVRDACLRNSATWKLVVDPKLAAHLSTWEEWSHDPRLDAEAFRWSPDQARRQILESFYSEQPRRRSWRVIGAPGVGKSRLVLEATRHLSDSVLVAPTFTSDLTHLMRDLAVGWVVVDECTDEQHESLVALAAGTDTRIITMGRDTQPSASASGFLRLPVMAWKETVQLVPRSVTDLELRETIARKAGGYPKLLRLYAKAVANSGADASTDDRGLDRALLELLRHEFKTNQQALQCWAIPSIATTSEVVALAAPLQISALEIDRARKFLNDEGLLGSVGDGESASHYVTPILFAEWLAKALWDTSGPRILEAVAGAPERVRHECIRRLTNGGTGLRGVLAALEIERVVQLLNPAAVSDIASALAPGEPDRALALVRRLLHPGTDPVAPRAAIWALRTLAWFPETFAAAVELLAEAVDASTGHVLVDLFGTFMGVTRADGTLRMAALDNLIRIAPGWAVECAAEACDVERSRGTGGLPGTLEEAWRPRSREEERRYVDGAIAALCRLLEAPGDTSGAQKACANAVRSVFSRVLGETVEPIVSAFIRLRLPTTELHRAFELVEEFDLAQLGDERQSQEVVLQGYVRRLPSRTLGERIERLVDSTLWFRKSAEDPPSEASALAKELVGTESAAEILRGLAAVRGPGAYEFGRLCSREDQTHRLVPLQLALAPAAAHQQFSVGYFVDWPRDELDLLLGQWGQDSTLGPFVFDLIHRIGGSDLRARLVIDLIDRGVVPPLRLGDLYMGAWLWNVSDALALRILEKTPLPSRLLIADQWCRHDSSRVPVVVDAWHQVHGSDLDGMVDHVWGEIARKAREHDPARFSATMVERLREAGEGRSSPLSLGQVLSDWLATEPDAIAMILTAALDDQRVMWPIRELLLSPASAAAAVDWARQHPDSAWLVAPLSTGFDEIALGLLEAVPRGERLAGALSARVRTGHYWGSGTEFWTSRADQLERLAARASLESARRWFVAHARDARRRARHAQQHERASEEGVIPLPSVADR